MEKPSHFFDFIAQETLAKYDAQHMMMKEIREAKGHQYPPYTHPVMLVHGALGTEHELHDTKTWLKEVGGLTQVEIANIFTWSLFSPIRRVQGNLRPLVERLVTQLKELPEPAVLIGFSVGGTIAAIAASEHPELVREIISVDGPISPVNHKDFHPLTTILPINDVTSTSVQEDLSRIPHPRSLCFRIPGSYFLSRRATERSGVLTKELPEETAHAAMPYDTVNVWPAILTHLNKNNS